jgi:hypothetical protein
MSSNFVYVHILCVRITDGDSFVRGKIGSAPGARAAVIAPTADKVTECGCRAGHVHGRVRVWQVSEWTEETVFKLREAEQGHTA